MAMFMVLAIRHSEAKNSSKINERWDIYTQLLAMGRAASMDGMAGSFAVAAWNSDRSMQWRLLVDILCLEIWGLWLMKKRCLSLGLNGDFGFG